MSSHYAPLDADSSGLAACAYGGGDHPGQGGVQVLELAELQAERGDDLRRDLLGLGAQGPALSVSETISARSSRGRAAG